jgi:DMSO/TMAO reductase YedYZ molybdopterin-dependent catalytic subunit
VVQGQSRPVPQDRRQQVDAGLQADGRRSTSLDMATALHPQTILAIDFEDAPLAPEWGAPVRLRIPTKFGFKSVKNLQAIEVTNIYPGGFWQEQDYNWFSGS